MRNFLFILFFIFNQVEIGFSQIDLINANFVSSFYSDVLNFHPNKMNFISSTLSKNKYKFRVENNILNLNPLISKNAISVHFLNSKINGIVSYNSISYKDYFVHHFSIVNSKRFSENFELGIRFSYEYEKLNNYNPNNNFSILFYEINSILPNLKTFNAISYSNFNSKTASNLIGFTYLTYQYQKNSRFIFGGSVENNFNYSTTFAFRYRYSDDFSLFSFYTVNSKNLGFGLVFSLNKLSICSQIALYPSNFTVFGNYFQYEN